jgi:hypothetical protein
MQNTTNEIVVGQSKFDETIEMKNKKTKKQ